MQTEGCTLLACYASGSVQIVKEGEAFVSTFESQSSAFASKQIPAMSKGHSTLIYSHMQQPVSP